MRCTLHIERMGSDKFIQNRCLLTAKNRSLGARRLRWEDNIKMNHKEIKRGGVGCVHEVHVRDQRRRLMNFWSRYLAADFFE
jgi:hypothetical protein